MRILYFYQYFTTPKGSYNTRVYEFARRWAGEGHSVTVVTSVFDRSDLRSDKFLETVHIEGIEVRLINIRLSNKHGFFHRLFTFAVFALMACWYALTLPADVVIASSGPLTIGLPGLLARYVRRLPLLFEVRDLWPEGSIQMGYLRNPILIRAARLFERFCYRSATRVIALSEGMADWIRATYGVANLSVVPNASDTRLFDQYRNAPIVPDWAKGKKLIVYAGNLGPGDDVGQILEMAKRLFAIPGADEMELVIIGDGKQGQMLRDRAQAESVRIRFTGLISRRELVQFLGAAHCTLCVTRSLPFYDTCSPNKLFDSLAAGVPMVQTTQGWIKTLFEGEGCGTTVRQDDPEALAQAVWSLVTDEELRLRMGSNALRVARSRFDRDVLSRQLIGLIEAAAGRSAAPPRPPLEMSKAPSRG